MSRVRIKFCGITRAEDARACADMGVDAIGLVFVARSPRALDSRRANEILEQLPPLVSVVALFMDAPPAQVNAVLDAVPIDLLQFHGSETAEYCAQFARPYIKALAMGESQDLDAAARDHGAARGLLLDAHRRGESGGRGIAFDWSRIPTGLAARILLAGGLNPDNVGAAVRQVRPYAVDVSSGIESAPGVKCARRMQKFIDEVSRASR